MTVDDDPGVSRSGARDLRRRYGEEFRIVRAESGPDALDALREPALRGGPVAAILADYRMPEMNAPSTWWASTTTCSSRGTRRRKSSTR